jgi:hypothetical protein
MRPLLMFRVERPEKRPIRALLEADHAYYRARRLRHIAVTALAVAGCAAWVARSAGGGAIPHLVLAAWLTLLVFTVGAVIAEISAWDRLHRAIEETKR